MQKKAEDYGVDPVTTERVVKICARVVGVRVSGTLEAAQETSQPAIKPKKADRAAFFRAPQPSTMQDNELNEFLKQKYYSKELDLGQSIINSKKEAKKEQKNIQKQLLQQRKAEETAAEKAEKEAAENEALARRYYAFHGVDESDAPYAVDLCQDFDDCNWMTNAEREFYKTVQEQRVLSGIRISPDLDKKVQERIDKKVAKFKKSGELKRILRLLGDKNR